MKTNLKSAIIGVCTVLMFMFEPSPQLPLQVELVPQAHAVFGVRRRAFRRGVIIGGSAAAAETAAVAADSQAATAPPPPAPAASGAPLPIGTVVQSLPGGCTSTPQGGVNYYYCSGNFYRVPSTFRNCSDLAGLKRPVSA